MCNVPQLSSISHSVEPKAPWFDSASSCLLEFPTMPPRRAGFYLGRRHEPLDCGTKGHTGIVNGNEKHGSSK